MDEMAVATAGRNGRGPPNKCCKSATNAKPKMNENMKSAVEECVKTVGSMKIYF